MTPHELLAIIGYQPHGPVLWRERVSEKGPGIYLVVVPDPALVTIDTSRLKSGRVWVADEPVIYIGRTIHLRTRIDQFYRQVHGEPKPHHGGDDVLLISSPKLVYWCPMTDYIEAERRLIREFEKRLGRLPFANRQRQ